MALALLDRASDAFADFLEGAAMSFDIDSPPAGTEAVPQGRYDVGHIVGQKTLEWLGSAPNLATPANLLLLLEELDEVTQQVEAHVKEHGPEGMVARAGSLALMVPSVFGVAAWMAEDKARREHLRALEASMLDLRRWRVRLDRYVAYVEAAIPEREDGTRGQGERMAVLWEVTSPLFLGWFGGETGTEIELPEGGVPENFNTEARHLPDLGEPFRLANAFDVWLEWKQRTPTLLVEDTADEAAKVAEKAAGGALGVLPKVLPDPPTANPWAFVLVGAAGLAVGGVGVALWRHQRRKT